MFIGRGRGGLGAFGVKGAFLKAHVLGEAWYCVYGDRPYANIHHSLRSENYGCIQPQVFQLLLPLCNAKNALNAAKMIYLEHYQADTLTLNAMSPIDTDVLTLL